MLMQKSLAFIEYETLENALAAVELTTQNEYKIRQNRIFFSFTNREKITFDMDIDYECGWVLLVTITNIKYPVNIEILHWIFSKYGFIQKIIMF